MSQAGTLFNADVGRVVRFRITKSTDITFGSAVVMVTPPAGGTSAEWAVTIGSQTSTQIVLLHTILSGDLPASGAYLWRAFFYDDDGDEVDATGEQSFTVRSTRVTRPEGS